MRFFLFLLVSMFVLTGCNSTLDKSKVTNSKDLPKAVYEKKDTMVFSEYKGKLYVFKKDKPVYKVKLANPKEHIIINEFYFFIIIWLFSISCGLGMAAWSNKN